MLLQAYGIYIFWSNKIMYVS